MRVAICQMNSLPDVHKNMSSVSAAFAKAADQAAALLVFPEMMLAMAATREYICGVDWDEVIAGLARLSKTYGIACIAGTLPLEDPQHPQKRLSSSVFIDALGDLRACYNKIHLFDADPGDEKGGYRESRDYSAGDKPVLIDMEGVAIGMAVCFDLRFPTLFQQYKARGAKVIVVPSAFTEVTGKKHWQVLLQARAIETQCFIVAPNQAGTHADGRRTWGQSMVVGPDGEVLVNMEKALGVMSCDLDFDHLNAVRRAIPLKGVALDCH